MRADIAKRKALDWLVERITIVDEDGNTLVLSDLEVDDGTDDADEDEQPEPTGGTVGEEAAEAAEASETDEGDSE